MGNRRAVAVPVSPSTLWEMVSDFAEGIKGTEVDGREWILALPFAILPVVAIVQAVLS